MAELSRLGKYEIWRELGRGAMGVVYEAFDPLIQRTVAIKTILKSSFDKSEAAEAFSRFRREAQAAGRLTHPKIVSIYEYGEDEEMAYIVMELIHGRELKDYFDHEERFEIKDGVRIVLQLLDALDYSHSRGVVHRDIKPANIMITDEGGIKVADFGIAKIESTHLTQAGIVLGTPTYMSPEQFMGKDVDRRTDIYSAGVVLYQFLTGTRPFTGSVIAIMHKAVNQEAVPPSQLNPDVPKALDEVVGKAMAKRPEERYQTAAEFMEALKQAAQEAPTPVAEKSLISASAMFAEADETIVRADGAAFREKQRLGDIESWRGITDSRNPSDFRHYLKEYPAGQFAELARVRIAALEKSGDRADKESTAIAEAPRKQEDEEKARLARKVAEIRSEAAEAQAKAAERHKKEAGEQARRARELAGVMAEKGKKLAGIVAEREAERETRRKLEAEAKQQLADSIRRKREAEEEEERIDKERAEAKARAEAEARRKREEEARQRRELELAEARTQAEARRKQAEAAAEARRARIKVLSVAVAAAIAVAGAALWLALR